MIDNDVTVPKNALKCFLEDPKDVCLGFYAYRPANNVYSGKICLCKLGEYNYTDLYTANEFETLRLAGTYREKIHGGGMGCAFINMKVFNKIKYPYYYWKQYENGGTLSEDLWFCSQCAKNEIDIYGDTRVGCGHMLRKIQVEKLMENCRNTGEEFLIQLSFCSCFRNCIFIGELPK